MSGFLFQAEDGIRGVAVTGVQTCALPILCGGEALRRQLALGRHADLRADRKAARATRHDDRDPVQARAAPAVQIGRASCRERASISVVAASLHTTRAAAMLPLPPCYALTQ